MPRPPVRPMTPEDLQALQRVRAVSVHDRQHKVHVADFVDPQAWQANGNLRALFPRLLKGLDHRRRRRWLRGRAPARGGPSSWPWAPTSSSADSIRFSST